MIEFKVNDFITLRLEGQESIIYVANERFLLCKFLLLNINVKKMSTFDEIDSIDEAAEKLGRSYGSHVEASIELPTEVEFWGHCSNLQVWYEHNYDTRLLHSNLAFPLLKRLTKVGDPVAKKVFREEIGKRLTSNNLIVVSFLTKENYLIYLEPDDFIAIKDELSDEVTSNIKDIIFEMFQKVFNSDDFENQNKFYEVLSVFCTRSELSQIQFVIHKSKKCFVFDGYLRVEDVDDIREIQGLDEIQNLKTLNLAGNKITKINGLENLKTLEELNLSGNQIQEISGLDQIITLKILDLCFNKISEIDSLEKLNNLEVLWLSSNEISEIRGLRKLTKLNTLYLDSNQIEKIKGFDTLINLKTLDLNRNRICKIEGLDKLMNLENLFLDHNEIHEIGGLDNLYNLRWLNLVKNKITEIEGLENIKKLEVLNLENNRVSEIKGLKGLRRLEVLNLNYNKLPDPYDNRDYEGEEIELFTF